MKNFNLRVPGNGILLLFGVFLLLNKSSFAFDLSESYIGKATEKSGVDEYGVYVELQIPIKHWKNSLDAGDAWYLQSVNTGSIKLDDHEVVSFNGSDQRNDVLYVTLLAGSARYYDGQKQWVNLPVNSRQGLHIGSTDPFSEGTVTLQLRYYLDKNYPDDGPDVFVGEYVNGWGFSSRSLNPIPQCGNPPNFFICGGDIGDQESNDTNFDKVSVPHFSDLKFTHYQYEDGNILLYWTSQNSAIIPHSYTRVDGRYSGSAYQQKGSVSKVSSGSFVVGYSNYETIYRLHQSAYGDKISLDGDAIHVPGFPHADNLTARFNPLTNQVDLKWSIIKTSGSHVTADFKLQRATKADFSDAVNIGDEASLKYDPDKESYSFSDDLREGELYYRVARDYRDEDHLSGSWGWGQGVSTHVNYTHAAIRGSSHVNLELDEQKLWATLTWDTTGIWTNGSQFIITQFDETTNASTEIKLGEEEYKQGLYIDSLIAPCHQYHFTLQVVPVAGLGIKVYSPYRVENSILAVRIGKIKDLEVSKGYFPDRTELRWRSEGSFDNYIVKRRIYGSPDNYTQIATVPGTNITDIQTDDSRGTPGTYYEYTIVGSVTCNHEVKYSHETLYGIGFRAPTGDVYGRVTFENGQPVENVAVRLAASDGARLGKSVYLNGSAQSFLAVDSLQTPFSDSALTVEAWIKPDDKGPANEVILSREGQYELGFGEKGKLYFTYNGRQVSCDYPNTHGRFVHVTGIHDKGSLTIMVNDSVMVHQAISFSATTGADKSVYMGRRADGRYFKGYIDEVSVWNVALTPQVVARDYTRLLTGGEAGLAAYWRFDESITDHFYDLSYHNEDYNKNDGQMSAADVSRSEVIPDEAQLSLKAYTDAGGNYMVNGIPYGGRGTTYTIAPLLGTHQFDPGSANRLISGESNSFTVDFTDKSSFPVTGIIYYRNSTVPVRGVQFQIDGKYAQQSNGKIIESDAQGRFGISVPVGTHEVKAVKLNHVFEDGGKITDLHGENLNYQAAAGPFTLYDSTTIRFIGRVGGGTIQEAYPLGHSLSSNNLGESLAVTLVLAGAATGKINAGDDMDSVVTVAHFLPSNQPDSSKIHHTRVDYEAYDIVIHPDSLTGEFAADIIPENFNVTSVTATGHEDLTRSNHVNLDLTNQFVVQHSAYAYEDSIPDGKQGWIHKHYQDTVSYNASYEFIERTDPVISVSQVTNFGTALPFFGDSIYNITTFNGNAREVKTYDGASGRYLFGYPVFRQNGVYHLEVKAFEQYPFYKQGDLQTPASLDRVPTQGGLGEIDNTIRAGTSAKDTFSLDSKGEGSYQFTVGEPQLSDGIGRKGFAVNVTVGSTTYSWNGGNKQYAYVMGGVKNGNDFYTAGPNRVLAVLRDPPGSGSYSYLEQGTTFTTLSAYVGSAIQSGNMQFDEFLGTGVTTFAGVGAGTINNVEVENSAGGTFSHEESYTGTNQTVQTVTLLDRYETSSDPSFVGADADLFIGNSTNYAISSSMNLMIVDTGEVRGDDRVYFDGKKEGEAYSIVQRAGLNIGQRYGTIFVYPAAHIENEVIPQLVKVRNSFLSPKTITPTEAQAKANSSGEEVYVSKLSAADPNYGVSNGDTKVFGQQAKDEPWDDGSSYKIYFPATSDYNGTDTILTINQWIEGWEQQLSDNEKVKLTATDLIKNYSFTGGGSVEHAYQASASHTRENDFNFIVGGGFVKTTGLKLNKTGVRFTMEENIRTEQGGNLSNDTTTTHTFGFVLAGSQDGYISTDVYKATDTSFVFKTKGGATACPYEGASVTKYYSPGKVIDQPTVQKEIPKIDVDKPVVTDVPSDKSASFTVYMHNGSSVEEDTYFGLKIIDASNPYGAEISMDGATLGTGVDVLVPAGKTLTKTITLRKGPDSLNYNNIQLVLHSTCSYSPVGELSGNIADTVNLSAHFIPSCSDIQIDAPVDKWILNTSSPIDEDSSRYLPVVLSRFDVNYSQFDHIELQYKPSSSSLWNTVMKFYADSGRQAAAQGSKQMISDNSEIDYTFPMSDGAFNDQKYNIRAVSVCMDNGQEIARTPSNIVNGVKDTYTPRLFGTPEPGNGVLGIGREIRLNFNEPIEAGLLAPANFKVTGIRNGAQGDHSVSVRLDGESDYITTEFRKNISNRDITAEMWILADGPEDGTVFSQGNINESMELAVTRDNHLQVTVGKKTLTSDKPFEYEAGSWAHVALVYDAGDSTVSAFYNFKPVIDKAQVPAYQGTGVFQFGRSIATQGNFFAGKMHEARIWTADLTAITLQINSLNRYSGAEDGLMAYYPMTEGKGGDIFDKAHGNNASLTGTWSTPSGKAIAVGGGSYGRVATGTLPITPAMDYTLSLWFKGAAGQDNAALVSNGRGDGSDPGPTGSRDLFFLGFEDGVLTFRNNGFKVQAGGQYLDNSWHQVALAVSRTAGSARLYVDGVLKNYFNTQNLGGIASAYIYLGARAYYADDLAADPTIDESFTGKLDEFRVWDTYLGQSLIAQKGNVRLNGDELGLMAYYPFETYKEQQGQKLLDTTLADQKLQQDAGVVVPPAVLVGAVMSDDMAPVKDRGPVNNLNFDYVVNNDALIINMLEPRQAIDKTTLTFQVADVSDLQGNRLVSPITWTAYVDKNPLNWSDDELNLAKDVYKPLQFESYIINSGGGNEHFTLDNLPAWLSADVTTGTVPPEGKQKVVFTVDEGLNVGSYNEIIYMRNDNGETASLPLDIKVNGETPDWKVNPADFKYNMTVYGKIRVDGIFSDNPDDMLAAFVGGKCVGLAHNSYFAGQDMWYAFLTIYNDSLHVDKVAFRIWDAGTGKIYQGIPSEPVSFVSDGVAGTPDVPVIFDGREMLFRNINLHKGWNWISFNLVNDDLNDIGAALANGSWTPGDVIKHDVRGFDQYSRAAGWVGTLSGLDNTSLFKMKATQQQVLSFGGTLPELGQTPLTVQGGRWNYIGYLPQVNMTLKEALADYPASDGDQIKSQTGFSMYSPTKGWVGNLTYLEPGKGYMLYRKAVTDVQFTYPVVSGSMSIHRLATNSSLESGRLNALQAPVVRNYDYESNMTVIAITDPSFTLMPQDKLLVYAGSDLRGEALAVSNPVINRRSFFFNVAGRENTSLHFEVQRGGRTVARTGPVMSYGANGMIGTLKAPFMMHFSKPSVEAAIFPNPFSHQVTLHGSLLPGTHEVQMSIYDVKGRLVYQAGKQEIRGGSYEAGWDGRGADGTPCGSGIYFIHLWVDGKSHVYKVVKK